MTTPQITYTLGFYPAEGAFDGKFHKLTVKVGQKNVSLRFRQGYFAAKTDSAAFTAPPTLTQLLQDPLDATAIGISAAASPDASQTGGYQVRVTIDLHDIHLEHQNNVASGSVDVSLFVEHSRTARTITRKIEIPDEQLAMALEKGVEVDGSTQSDNRTGAYFGSSRAIRQPGRQDRSAFRWARTDAARRAIPLFPAALAIAVCTAFAQTGSSDGRAVSGGQTREQAAILSAIRQYALNYTSSLPNYTCIEVIRRSMMPAPRNAGPIIRPRPQTDLIEEQLSFIAHREIHKVTRVNGAPVANLNPSELPGTYSRGEFGMLLDQIFEPRTETSFAWDRTTKLNGHRTVVFAFRVPQAHGYGLVEARRTIAPPIADLSMRMRQATRSCGFKCTASTSPATQISRASN